MFLKNQQIIEEIKKEIKICIETNENDKLALQGLEYSLCFSLLFLNGCRPGPSAMNCGDLAPQS